MFQKIANALSVEVDGTDLTKATKIEFYVRQGCSFFQYIDEALPTVDYTIRVDNQYPLPEDEQEEKQTDLAEVNAQTMSKKAYMKKWRNLTDDEADEELRQIAKERELLEDSFVEPPMEVERKEEGEGDLTNE